jgi:hypothetical protein
MAACWRLVAFAVMALVGLTPLSGSAVAADQAIELKFTDFYVDDFSIDYSERLKALAGKPIAVRGYMAPPLKPDGNFLVLTREPVALCPYCETDADWPRDTLVVYLRDERVQIGSKIKITGTLDIGSKTDQRTGFVSLVRLVNAEIVP